jgi:hypothetical protein
MSKKAQYLPANQRKESDVVEQTAPPVEQTAPPVEQTAPPVEQTAPPVVVPITAEEAIAQAKANGENAQVSRTVRADAKLLLAVRTKNNTSGIITVLQPDYKHKPGSLSDAAFRLMKSYEGRKVSECLEAGKAIGMNNGYFFGQSGWIARKIISVD